MSIFHENFHNFSKLKIEILRSVHGRIEKGLSFDYESVGLIISLSLSLPDSGEEEEEGGRGGGHGGREGGSP